MSDDFKYTYSSLPAWSTKYWQDARKNKFVGFKNCAMKNSDQTILVGLEIHTWPPFLWSEMIK